MAKSSIHIQSGNAGFLSHNSRERATKNSIFSDEKNEISDNQKEAFEVYRSELEKRSEAYTKRTKQKLQKKAITHLSAIVNLNSNHNMEDLKPLIKHLEDTLGTKVFQVAIHRDEGHIDDNKKPQKNYHAHIEFMGLDSEGNSVRKKLTKKYLSELQNETAKILQMERGTNYAKERKKRPKRLDTYEYKKVKEQEQQSRLAKQKDLKDEIKRLREQLKERGAGREDYAILEQLNRDLKEQIKSKELSFAELKSIALDYEQKNTEKDIEIFCLEDKLSEFKEAAKDNESENEHEHEQVKKILEDELDMKVGNFDFLGVTKFLTKEIKSLKMKKITIAPAPTTPQREVEDLEELEEENRALKKEVESLQEENSLLKSFVSNVSEKITSFEITSKYFSKDHIKDTLQNLKKRVFQVVDKKEFEEMLQELESRTEEPKKENNRYLHP